MGKKNIGLAMLLAVLVGLHTLSSTASEEPVQHLELADITSIEQAKKVFFETTTQLKSKTKLDSAELNEVHIVTYSLEKAVAYFSENTVGERQAVAKIMAELVELIHIGSENNRATQTSVYLSEYFKLAEMFAKDL